VDYIKFGNNIGLLQSERWVDSVKKEEKADGFDQQREMIFHPKTGADATIEKPKAESFWLVKNANHSTPKQMWIPQCQHKKVASCIGKRLTLQI
jgi:hypothetical protein